MNDGLAPVILGRGVSCGFVMSAVSFFTPAMSPLIAPNF